MLTFCVGGGGGSDNVKSSVFTRMLAPVSCFGVIVGAGVFGFGSDFSAAGALTAAGAVSFFGAAEVVSTGCLLVDAGESQLRSSNPVSSAIDCAFGVVAAGALFAGVRGISIVDFAAGGATGGVAGATFAADAGFADVLGAAFACAAGAGGVLFGAGGAATVVVVGGTTVIVGLVVRGGAT